MTGVEEDSDDTLCICTFIDKGGVGKTTTTAHLAVALSRKGLRTIVIDLAGKQADQSKQFGMVERIAEHDDWPNISTVFQPEWADIVAKYREKFDADAAEELIYSTEESVDLIPAHPGLDSLEAELDNKFSDARKFTRLESFLEEHINPHYDAVLLDLPGMANNVAFNGIFAAGNIITPVQAGSFESQQTAALERELEIIRENYGRSVKLAMLIPNMIDTRTNLSEKYLGEYAEEYGDALAEPVPRSQDIANAQDEGRTIFALEEPSSTAKRAIDAYETNADELVRRVRGVPA